LTFEATADRSDREFKPLVKKDSPGELLFLSRKDVESRIGEDWQSPSAADSESKDRSRLFESARLPHTLPALVFLGIDDRPAASSESVPAKVDPKNPVGVPYFAIDAGKDGADWEVEGGVFGDARASASSMSGWEAGVFAQARALIDWNCRNLVSHRS
jgi:NAD+ diphosphatase